MARNKGKRTEEEVEASMEEVMTSATTQPEPVPEPVVAPAPAPVPAGTPVFTFDRWFAQTGKPEHHKVGMRTFLKRRTRVQGKRTVAAWDALFTTY